MEDIANAVSFAAVLLGLFAYLSVRAWTNRPHCDHSADIAKLTELVRTLAELNTRDRSNT